MMSFLCSRTSPTYRQKILRLDESTPEALKLARYVEAFIRSAALNRRAKGTWMVITGPTGIGKTHALRHAKTFLSTHAVDFWSNNLWPSIPSTLFGTWSRIVAFERADWDNWVYDLRSAQMVFLDDVGSETDKFKTGEPAERFRIVLEICEKRFLLVSMNVSPTLWASAWDARVNSRLQRAVCLDLTNAPDFRTNIKTQTINTL